MSPQALVSNYLKRSLKQDARVAAVILRACPEFATNPNSGESERIDTFLERIGAGTIRSETVDEMLERARVYPRRRVSELRPWQRAEIAKQLEEFAEKVL